MSDWLKFLIVDRDFNLGRLDGLFLSVIFSIILPAYLSCDTSTSILLVWWATSYLINRLTVILWRRLRSSSFFRLLAIIEMRIKARHIFGPLFLGFRGEVSICVAVDSCLYWMTSLVLTCSVIACWNHVCLMTWRMDNLRLSIGNEWSQMLESGMLILRAINRRISCMLCLRCCFLIFRSRTGPCCDVINIWSNC